MDKNLIDEHLIEGRNNHIWFSTWYMCWRLDNDGKIDIVPFGYDGLP